MGGGRDDMVALKKPEEPKVGSTVESAKERNDPHSIVHQCVEVQ